MPRCKDAKRSRGRRWKPPTVDRGRSRLMQNISDRFSTFDQVLTLRATRPASQLQPLDIHPDLSSILRMSRSDFDENF